MLARYARASQWLRLALACLALGAAAPTASAEPDLPIAAEIAHAQPGRERAARAARPTARAPQKTLPPSPSLSAAALHEVTPPPRRLAPPRVPLFISHGALLR